MPRSTPATLRLRLYVAGLAPNSQRAVANLKALCHAEYDGRYHLEVVDILEQPGRALADGIIVSPTLLKLLPLPVARVIGDMSDTARVLQTLAAR